MRVGHQRGETLGRLAPARRLQHHRKRRVCRQIVKVTRSARLVCDFVARDLKLLYSCDTVAFILHMAHLNDNQVPPTALLVSAGNCVALKVYEIFKKGAVIRDNIIVIP